MIAIVALAGPLLGELGDLPLVICALGLIVALAVRLPQSLHVGIVTLLMTALQRFWGHIWPATSLILLVVYGALLWKIPFLQRSCMWWRKGTNSKTDALVALVFTLLSGAALVIWSKNTDADLAAFAGMIPDVPHYMIYGGVFFYACLNALFEEVIWRGVAMQAFEKATGSVLVALFFQAAAFGLWHFNGFPSGWIGAGLATIFALMMGWLRLRSQGLLLPLVAHVAADMTIFVIILQLVF